MQPENTDSDVLWHKMPDVSACRLMPHAKRYKDCQHFKIIFILLA
jgi:hypothetical protein